MLTWVGKVFTLSEAKKTPSTIGMNRQQRIEGGRKLARQQSEWPIFVLPASPGAACEPFPEDTGWTTRRSH